MDLQFKENVGRGTFRPSERTQQIEGRLRDALGLRHKYESARLSIGRSMAEIEPPPVSPEGGRGVEIHGHQMFGEEIDLWMAAVIVDGKLGPDAAPADLRALVEAHWDRGALLLESDLRAAGDDVALIRQLVAHLPAGGGGGTGRGGTSPDPAVRPGGTGGAIRVPVGPVSRTLDGKEPVEIELNGPAASPHVALMGRTRSGKTTTGVQMALDIQAAAGVPLLFIDPKGEFVEDGKLVGRLAESPNPPTLIEAGRRPIPLDFLPDPGVGNASIAIASMQFAESIGLCCKSFGDVQRGLLKAAVGDTIRTAPARSLAALRDAYAEQLQREGKGPDGVSSRLDDVGSSLSVFAPQLSPADFFAKSWVISLNGLGSADLKRLATMLLLDALKNHVANLPEAPVPGGFRSLRHMLVIDEAKDILQHRKYESLVALVRQGASKGQVVMFLSQDPGDFQGQADDFTTQLGTVIAFACNQTQRGLSALNGAYGRRLQPTEFSDTYLPPGVAFCKLPGRRPERVQCWSAG